MTTIHAVNIEKPYNRCLDHWDIINNDHAYISLFDDFGFEVGHIEVEQNDEYQNYDFEGYYNGRFVRGWFPKSSDMRYALMDAMNFDIGSDWLQFDSMQAADTEAEVNAAFNEAFKDYRFYLETPVFRVEIDGVVTFVKSHDFDD